MNKKAEMSIMTAGLILIVIMIVVFIIGATIVNKINKANKENINQTERIEEMLKPIPADDNKTIEEKIKNPNIAEPELLVK